MTDGDACDQRVRQTDRLTSSIQVARDAATEFGCPCVERDDAQVGGQFSE